MINISSVGLNCHSVYFAHCDIDICHHCEIGGQFINESCKLSLENEFSSMHENHHLLMIFLTNQKIIIAKFLFPAFPNIWLDRDPKIN